MEQVIHDHRDLKLEKEDTGLGGDTQIEGRLHALRGIAFLIALALLGAVSLAVVAKLTQGG